jgi:hypothetical protein
MTTKSTTDHTDTHTEEISRSRLQWQAFPPTNMTFFLTLPSSQVHLQLPVTSITLIIVLQNENISNRLMLKISLHHPLANTEGEKGENGVTAAILGIVVMSMTIVYDEYS